MNCKFYLLITAFACLVSNVLYAQHSLSGKISDSDGNPLIGAVVMLTSNLGTVSDIDGNYSISAKEGDYTVKVTSVGMKPASAAVALRGNITQDFTLETDALGLEEVLVTSVRNNQSKLESSVSVSTLSPRTIDQLGARPRHRVARATLILRCAACLFRRVAPNMCSCKKMVCLYYYLAI